MPGKLHSSFAAGYWYTVVRAALLFVQYEYRKANSAANQVVSFVIQHPGKVLQTDPWDSFQIYLGMFCFLIFLSIFIAGLNEWPSIQKIFFLKKNMKHASCMVHKIPRFGAHFRYAKDGPSNTLHMMATTRFLYGSGCMQSNQEDASPRDA